MIGIGCRRIGLVGLLGLLLNVAAGRVVAADTTPDHPHALDPRLEVSRFAAAPEIVHPISIDFDAKGRLLVIESHTHFRPEGYQGPAADRVRMLEDTDGDDKADRITTFFEGTRFSMDIAVHPTGVVYLATRNEILQLRDGDHDGKADESRRVVFLETAGNYPHNGLSGLAFNSKGDLFFGLGENLGADYTLRGADGTEIRGGGEGGNIFTCSPDGKGLRKVATGFWNPFGIGFDIFGRMFAIDNDPDSMPPCRLLHVVEGGDYGYQFRYGRSGRHVFQSWNGELPGTLPMLSGTGESPTEVLSYESDGLPSEYRGNLLVPVWADHRVDRYRLRERGASFVAEAEPLIRGGKDFRPVGLVTAPDGSLFVSDWVLSDYNLHGKGAVWHVRASSGASAERSSDPRRAILSAHRPVREAAARHLAADDSGRTVLREQLGNNDVRVRAACLTALIDAGDPKVELKTIAERDPDVGIRALAVRSLIPRDSGSKEFLDPKNPAGVRFEGVAALKTKADLPQLLVLLGDTDAFVRNAAVQRLATVPELLEAIDRRKLAEPKQRAGVLLAFRASGRPNASRLVGEFLADSEEDVRFLAAKWVSDQRLKEYAEAIAEALKDRSLNVRMYSAFATASTRLRGQEVKETDLAAEFLQRAADPQAASAQRVLALRLVPSNHPGLKPDFLSKLFVANDPALQLEAVRALCDQPERKPWKLLSEVVHDSQAGILARAQAIAGLAEHSQELVDEFVAIAESDQESLRDEALRSLLQTKLTPELRDRLARLAQQHPESSPLVRRVLGEPFAANRPRLEEVDAWAKRLEGSADPDAGRRVFFHSKLAACYRCHRVDGRGGDIGPDLSTIGRTDRRRILESILQPSNEVGPSFQAWQIETSDGKSLTGMLIRTNLDESTYLDAQGSLFKVRSTDVSERRGLPTSIMPSGLPDMLTDQELRDLLAYLVSRR